MDRFSDVKIGMTS